MARLAARPRAAALPAAAGGAPLERTEAIARFLRCECTLWDAKAAWEDSHKLYLRQWLALELQSLYRRRSTRREYSQRISGIHHEQRLRRAVGMWRQRTATRCFVAWRDLALKTLRARQVQVSALARLFGQPSSRAFNAWRERAASRKENEARIRKAVGMWTDMRMRALARWKQKTRTRHRRRQILTRAAKAWAAPDLRYAMNQWQALTATRRRALSAARKTIKHWQNRSVSVCFRQWANVSQRTAAGLRRRRALGGRGGGGRGVLSDSSDGSASDSYHRQLGFPPASPFGEGAGGAGGGMGARDLLGRPCVKKGEIQREMARGTALDRRLWWRERAHLLHANCGGNRWRGSRGLPTPVTPGGTAATPGGTGRVNSKAVPLSWWPQSRPSLPLVSD